MAFCYKTSNNGINVVQHCSYTVISILMQFLNIYMIV